MFWLIFFSQLLQYIQQKICSYEAHVVAMAKQLQDSVTQEVGRFAALPLNQIQYSELDRSVITLLFARPAIVFTKSAPASGDMADS